ncbi:hypothetical protein DFH07DRAFT_947314 [Mycena maculata]|uniref:Diaminopimelate epimerase-like protein n=1 Tax=Mycena maculata TaxID=230809 RepID=A0AAD7MIG9_9AGAR|nr:hypothetical protein DFH07DRAFT_947314 [Mycena maculata]
MKGHLDFEMINAFTTHTFGGNPSAIVFLKEVLSDAALEKIRDNFNQPIVVYVSPANGPPDEQGVPRFGLRWFGPRCEMRICGHGTLTAAGAIFRRLNVPAEISTLEFQTLFGTLTAKRVDDKIQMELPAGTTIPASAEEAKSVEATFCRALGKPTVALRYVAHGGPGFENYLFVEVDISEGLSTWRPEAQYFAELDTRTQILVVTSASRETGISYETRMFAPRIGVPEDHVCGSAHCLNAPYWAVKRGYPNGHEQHAKAVSARGGEIWSAYFEGPGYEPGRVQLRGHVKRTASGTLDLADAVIN